MKHAWVFALLLLFFSNSLAQTQLPASPKARKGLMYLYWGWNRDAFSHSAIRFQGPDYDFTLRDVVAVDKPIKFGLSPYFNPGKASIAQYNFRVGYFFNDHYNISFGVDHMKYVVKQGQVAKISGYIDGTETYYDGIYSDDDIIIDSTFLKFEHTDGLNYINLDLRRQHEISAFKNVSINLIEGIGGGVIIPKSNVTLINNERYDEFHFAGFGLNGIFGLNVTFFEIFFIQSELIGGYANLPDVRTTMSTADKASHDFLFGQVNFVFGGSFRIGKASEVNEAP